MKTIVFVCTIMVHVACDASSTEPGVTLHDLTTEIVLVAALHIN